jgi:hypothetical protein
MIMDGIWNQRKYSIWGYIFGNKMKKIVFVSLVDNWGSVVIVEIVWLVVEIIQWKLRSCGWSNEH